MKKFEITYHLTGNITLERIVNADSLEDAKKYIDNGVWIGFIDEYKHYHQFHGRNIVLGTIIELKN